MEGALDKVHKLLAHPDFVYTNPNRVRSLVGCFVQGNHRHFHATTGSGYQFLTTQLLHIDTMNPQLSGRLALPLTRWQRLDKPHQILIQAQLNVLNKHAMSNDLSELVHKSLPLMA